MNSPFFIPIFAGIEYNLYLLSKSISCKEYIMSKPLTQNKTHIENITGIILNSDVTAKYAADGLNDNPNPNIR